MWAAELTIFILVVKVNIFEEFVVIWAGVCSETDNMYGSV